jgi:hypothetical protein
VVGFACGSKVRKRSIVPDFALRAKSGTIEGKVLV